MATDHSDTQSAPATCGAGLAELSVAAPPDEEMLAQIKEANG